jgi:hypothetical protein
MPEHIRSLPSMAPRYTVHPEHKKATKIVAFVNNTCKLYIFTET